MAYILAILTALLIAPILIWFVNRYKKWRVFKDTIDNKISGPQTIPFFGNALQFPLSRIGFAQYLEQMCWTYGPNGIFRLWIGTEPIIILTRAELAELVLNSNVLIEKSNNYDILGPWLGTGLLTSTGDKWKERRKMLTPTFHFSILNSFVEVFNAQATILIERLSEMVKQDITFDIFPYIGRCALDIICETAMGVSIHAQFHTDSEYVTTVKRMSEIVFRHERSPWLWPKPLFYLSGYGYEYDRCLDILKGFTSKVIEERSQELNRKAKDAGVELSQLKSDKRPAFLDLLLMMQKENRLTNEHIREEVDTFMFEGHDTTASGISWAIFLVGHSPEVQMRIYEEMQQIFGDDTRMPTAEDLKDMRYLEAVIKESLRIYPPVPLFARRVRESTVLGAYEVPAGSTIMIIPVMMHRAPTAFDHSDEFRPERFLHDTSEAEEKRHPYSYVPFSAGPRNCIGQKFALMEEKVVLSTIVRNFVIKSIEGRDANPLLPELILRPPKKLLIRLTRRQSAN